MFGVLRVCVSFSLAVKKIGTDLNVCGASTYANMYTIAKAPLEMCFRLEM